VDAELVARHQRRALAAYPREGRGTSVFVAVQHPGEVSGASVENPASTWPNGRFPQPSVIVAWKSR
jgi:secreted PhoX family phosphatase